MTRLIDYRANDRLARALTLIKDLPPLSPMVRHLLATLYTSGEDTSLSQIAVWIEKDALTAGKVLALANSAYYGRTEPVLTIRSAISRLGLDAIRKLVLSMPMGGYWNRIPTPPEWSSSRFNAHSIGVAVLSEMIAAALSPANVQSAFLAGLFHDIGHIVIALVLRDNPDALKHLGVLEHAQLEELEVELVGFSHAELSATVVRSWNLPVSIENAVRFHEAPVDAERTDSGSIALSDILYVADCYVDYEGLSIRGARKSNKDHLELIRQLNLGINEIIFRRFHDELDILLSIL
jgi:putative nucleotidyltransferase with HDIG domain